MDIKDIKSENESIKAWESWIDFPILRKRVDVLENYYPKRSKIILDVEETFPGCHSKARHVTQLTPNDLQLRAKGEHPTLPPTKKSTKFDSEQLHDDAVNTAFNQHKADIEAHFANGGGYKEWDIDNGSQVGSGYYNSGEYGAGAVLNEVTTTKIKISFNKDPSNPTALISSSGQANVTTTNSFTTLSGKVVPNNITIKVKEVRVFSIDDFANLIVKTF